MTKGNKRAPAFDKKILSGDQIALLEERVRELFGPQLWAYVDAQHFDVRAKIAFTAVSTRCKEAREMKGLSIKEVAGILRVPQYRVREIEEGHVRQIDPVVLQSYVTFLGLTRWFSRWKNAQTEIPGK